MSHILQYSLGMTGGIPMNKTTDQTLNLPKWYDKMLSNPILMILFVFAVLMASPVLLVYGAFLPLFRK